jgi:hypothetical protein
LGRIRAETTWCPGRSQLEVGWARLLTAELGNILCKAYPGKASSDPRAERHLGYALVLDSVAEDLADFFFGATTVTACANLELGFHVIIEVSD